MDSYVIAKIVHVLAAMTLVGPSVLAPVWVKLMADKVGGSMIQTLHRLTGLSGWIVLIVGTIMIFITESAFLHQTWMQVSLALFLATQVFDHFWADSREEAIASGNDESAGELRNWLIVKSMIYMIITILMVLKP